MLGAGLIEPAGASFLEQSAGTGATGSVTTR